MLLSCQPIFQTQSQRIKPIEVCLTESWRASTWHAESAGSLEWGDAHGEKSHHLNDLLAISIGAFLSICALNIVLCPRILKASVVEITFLQLILCVICKIMRLNHRNYSMCSVEKQNWTALTRHLIILSKLLVLRLLSTDCVTVQLLFANQEIGRHFNSCYPSLLQNNSKEVVGGGALLVIGKCNHVEKTCSQKCWQDLHGVS